MKLQLNKSLILLGLLVTSACNISPKAISYNEDQCDACKMIISDKKFGAELVTTKGKVYTYDAIECLVPEVLKNGEENYSFILVTDYLNPGTLINAKQSSFLVSKNLPSPMGGYLSAYIDLPSAKSAHAVHSGDIFNWETMKSKYQ